VCPLSKRIITENDEVIRFMNMQLFLLTAINEYGSQQSSRFLYELTIPGTDEPMLPSQDDISKLAQEIRSKLSQFSWYREKFSAQNESCSSYISSARTPTPAAISPPTFISPRKLPTSSSEFIIDMNQETQADDPQGKKKTKKENFMNLLVC